MGKRRGVSPRARGGPDEKGARGRGTRRVGVRLSGARPGAVRPSAGGRSGRDLPADGRGTSARRESGSGSRIPTSTRSATGRGPAGRSGRRSTSSSAGITSLEGGGVIVDFADSYKHEIASYELDKLLGTGLVPPTVERTFGGTEGLPPAVGGGGDDGGRPQEEEDRPARPPGLERADVQGAAAAPAHRQHRLPQHQQRALRPVVPGLRGRLLARLHHLRGPARPRRSWSASPAPCSRP